MSQLRNAIHQVEQEIQGLRELKTDAPSMVSDEEIRGLVHALRIMKLHLKAEIATETKVSWRSPLCDHGEVAAAWCPVCSWK